MIPAVVFDDGLGELAPLTHLRAAFDVRTGALTTLERLRHTLGLQIVSLYVPEALADLTAEAHDLPINRLPSDMADGSASERMGRSSSPSRTRRWAGSWR